MRTHTETGTPWRKGTLDTLECRNTSFGIAVGRILAFARRSTNITQMEYSIGTGAGREEKRHLPVLHAQTPARRRIGLVKPLKPKVLLNCYLRLQVSYERLA